MNTIHSTQKHHRLTTRPTRYNSESLSKRGGFVKSGLSGGKFPRDRVQIGESPVPVSKKCIRDLIGDVLARPGKERYQYLTESEAAVSDYVRTQAPPARPEEKHLWEGLVRWRVRREISDSRPRWNGYATHNVVKARMMWDNSTAPFSITDLAAIAEYPGYREKFASRKMEGILDMVAGFLGPKKTLEAVDAFLSQRGGAPTQINELWQSLPSVGGMAPDKLMETWTHQPRMPIVRSRTDGTSVLLSQESFKLYPDEEGDFGQRWSIPVPILYRDAEGIKEHKILLDESSRKVDLPAVGSLQWAFPNAGGQGLYRTDLAEHDFLALEKDFHKLDKDTQFALVSNQWRLVRNGKSDVGRFLSLARAAAPEADRSILGLLGIEVDYLSRCRVKAEDREAFNELAQELLRPGLDNLRSYRPVPTDDIKAFELSLAMVGDKEVLARYAEELKKMEPGGRQWEIWSAVLQSPEAQRGWLAELEDKEAKPEHTARVGYLLSFSNDPKVQERLLDSLSSAKTLSSLYNISNSTNDQFRKKAWDKFRTEWRELANFEGWMQALAGTPYRSELRTLILSKNDPAALEYFDREVWRSETRFMEHVAPGIGMFLSERKSAASAPQWNLMS